MWTRLTRAIVAKEMDAATEAKTAVEDAQPVFVPGTDEARAFEPEKQTRTWAERWEVERAVGAEW